MKILSVVLSGLLVALMCPPSMASDSGQGYLSTHTDKKSKKKFKKKPNSYYWARRHYEVLMSNNIINRIRYVDNDTNAVLVESFPHGMFAANRSGETKRFSVNSFRGFIAERVRREKKERNKYRKSNTKQAATQSVTYNTGLALGYNASTGYIGGSTCFNNTVSLSNNFETSSFTNQNTASSSAGQTNASASISGAYEAFKASDTFSYSNSYDNSANSGQIFFNAAATYTASNVNYGLNAQGSQASTSGVFSTQCGSQFITTVPVGMLITGQFSWATSSSSTGSSISNSFNASYGLDSIATAVSNSTTQTDSTSSYSFTLVVIGGSTTAQATINNAYADQDANMQACWAGNNTDCTTFTSALIAGASNALSTFQSGVQPTLPTDLASAGLVAFPNGIAVYGFQGPYSPSYQPVTGYTDVLSGNVAQLNNYLTVLNQIATLNNRVGYLSGTGSTSSATTVKGLATPNLCNYQACNPTPYSSTMNPAPEFDISGDYLGNLQSIYSSDYQTMTNNLQSCLGYGQTGTSADTLSSNCSAVNNIYGTGTSPVIASAYDWYTNESGLTGSSYAPNSFAAQNSIALQYTGTYYLNQPGYYPVSYPLDVMWIDSLPVFTPNLGGLPSGVSAPSQQAALIAFADAPYPQQGNPSLSISAPYVTILPSITSPASSATISAATSTYSPYWFNLTEYGNFSQLGWNYGSGATSTISYNCNDGDSQYPTFSNPCDINAFTESGNVNASLYPLPSFFVTDQ